MAGGTPYHLHPGNIPGHVTRELSLAWRPSILLLPDELERLIDYRHPDALAVSADIHSHRCYTVTVLDLDYRYYTWRANLAVDGHWTLAPVYVPEDNGRLNV